MSKKEATQWRRREARRRKRNRTAERRRAAAAVLSAFSVGDREDIWEHFFALQSEYQEWRDNQRATQLAGRGVR